MKLILCALMILCPVYTPAGAAEMILFGFSSPEIDDVQERIFREEIMRVMMSRGVNTVPVSEIEYLVNEKELSLRTISAEQMKSAAYEQGIRFAVKGEIILAKGKYIVTLIVYDSAEGRLLEKKISFAGTKPFAALYKTAAAQCAGELISLLK